MNFTDYENVLVYKKEYERIGDKTMGGSRFRDAVMDACGAWNKDKFITDDLVYIGVEDWYGSSAGSLERFMHTMLFDLHVKTEIKDGLVWLTPMTKEEIDIFENEED